MGDCFRDLLETDMAHPRFLFLFGMIQSFLDAARDALDPVLQGIDGYRPLDTDATGRPVAPAHVVRKFSELPQKGQFRHVGASFVATTNLGHAYVYSFKLLNLLETGRDVSLSGSSQCHLAKLYDELSEPLQRSLSDIYSGIGSHDFEMEVGFGASAWGEDDHNVLGAMNLSQQLRYWDSHGMLQDSHRKLVEAAETSVIQFLIPLRAMLLLDRILATQIAPRLGLKYMPMDQEMSSRTKNPDLEWDGTTVSVSLPDKRGRVMQAKWEPTVTSVVRIREVGVKEWSPGFEIPFNRCTFVGLKPDTEYEMKVTHKNAAGEGEAAYTKVRTRPEGQ